MRIKLIVFAVFFVFSALQGCTSDGGGAATISSFSPADGDADVALDAAISAVASAALDISTVDQSTFTVIPTSSTNGSTTVCTGVDYDPDSKTISCAHGDLAPGVQYTITATTGIKSSGGTALSSDATASFTAIGTASSNSVVPKLVLPSFDAEGGTSLQVSFDRAVAEVPTSAIQVTTGSDATDLCDSVETASDGLSATCTLSSTIACTGAATKYTIVVNGDVRASDGGHSASPLNEYFSNWDDGFDDADTVAQTGVCWDWNNGTPTDANAVHDSNTTNAGKLTVGGSQGISTVGDGQSGPYVGKLNVSPQAAFGMTVKAYSLLGVSDFENGEGLNINLTSNDGASVVSYFIAAGAGAFTVYSANLRENYQSTGGLGENAVMGCENGCLAADGSSPVYFCITRSEDGATTMLYYDEEGDDEFTNLDLSSFDVPTLADPVGIYFLINHAAADAATFVADWVRFNIGEATCPPVTTVQ